MPQRSDESAEDDLLLAFSPEPDGTPPEPDGTPPELDGTPPGPGGTPPESTESLATRVECLERALHGSNSQIESLKSDVAKLVGTVGDIGKMARRPVTPAPKPVSTVRTRFLTATAGIVFGLTLGIMGWTLWSRESIDTIDTTVAPEAAAEELPVESASAPQPEESASAPQPVMLASAPRPVKSASAPQPVPRPAPTIAKEKPVQTPVAYVGTLSIDAAPGGEVFINREAAGQTPLLVKNLKAGSHLVWIEREGYRRFTRVVQVPANRVSRVWADLQPIPER